MFQLFGNLYQQMTSLANMEGQSNEPKAPYEPTVVDVLVVREMFNRALSLPPELIGGILDWAEYWPHTTAVADYQPGYKRAAGGHRNRFPESVFLIRSKPLGFHKFPQEADSRIWTEADPQRPSLKKEHSKEALHNAVKSPIGIVDHPCRKIVFTIRSRDQGWGAGGGTGTPYKHSWTWFEAGLERFEAGDSESTSPSAPTTLTVSGLRSIYPNMRITDPDHRLDDEHEVPANPAYTVQFNRTAAAVTQDHQVVWSYLDNVGPTSPGVQDLRDVGRGEETGDGEFVRNLKVGDVVTLWAHARFPGWENRVLRAQVDVYWAV